MSQPQPEWQLRSSFPIPEWLITEIKPYLQSEGNYAAQLLCQRGINNPETLKGFIDPRFYQPTSPLDFGQEMQWAIARLIKALDNGEKVAIWGDFDADGVTATSVLWEGLGQFFCQHIQLVYYIPDRLTESHGLNCAEIERLVVSGTKLIVTCDTGSTNLEEINYAHQLGIDIIITDHHTLPDQRPPVVSIINPRYFAQTHPLYSLSGVAVAYKLVEALYHTFPDLAKKPLENLLDLVAIGLIADLVSLEGDCRYLAQLGIKKLQQTQRLGVRNLLEKCKCTGDRPTDISFGIGPRINAVSRIQGQAYFCFQLLTSEDKTQCEELAIKTELANSRRQYLQTKMMGEVAKKIARLDLSTTCIIVLEDIQWEVGILGLVASQIANEYSRPTILFSISNDGIARGSARSIQGIDLYKLLATQTHLLHRFGGHPYAAGLSLAVENLPLFIAAINQQLRQIIDVDLLRPIIQADLQVTVAELSRDLFYELKLIEPCGMGNPAPKLLIKDCWFKNIKNQNILDYSQKKVQYMKTSFLICDDTCKQGFDGIWWGHSADELSTEKFYDVMVELDYNNKPKSKEDKDKGHYEVRLIAVREKPHNLSVQLTEELTDNLIDYRGKLDLPLPNTPARIVTKCPRNWDSLKQEYQQALREKKPLILAYSEPQPLSPEVILQNLVGIAKYLNRTNNQVNKEQLLEKLEISDRLLNLGLKALLQVGFKTKWIEGDLQVTVTKEIRDDSSIREFLEAVAEEQFQQRYFSKIPVSNLQNYLKV